MNYFKNTNIGVYRKENQDRVAVFENDIATMALLCDGMGGHFGGSIASSITIQTFQDAFNSISSNEDEIYDWFKNTIKKAKQNMIFEAKDDKNKQDMGTTVTSAIVYHKSKNIVIFNIGDSRTYLYDGILHQITTDHNLMNYYIQNEKISLEEARKRPGATALTSALGPEKKTNIEAFQISGSSTKRTLVLTSDGVHDSIEKPIMEMIIGNDNLSLEQKSESLIKEGIANGSKDNLSVIILEVN